MKFQDISRTFPGHFRPFSRKIFDSRHLRAREKYATKAGPNHACFSVIRQTAIINNSWSIAYFVQWHLKVRINFFLCEIINFLFVNQPNINHISIAQQKLQNKQQLSAAASIHLATLIDCEMWHCIPSWMKQGNAILQ